MQAPGVAPQFKRKQVHGVRSVEVIDELQDYGEADAFWTKKNGVVVAVNTADCVPILLKKKDSSMVAAIHAGWRGTLANIVGEFFSEHSPQEWTAYLGPAIHHCCYEVSEDIIIDFKRKYSSLSETKIEPSRQHLDLISINSYQLQTLGVLIENVHPDCTFCAQDQNGQPRYFSYRRGDRLSRQFSSIQIRA